MGKRRVVITGLGVVAPNGIGKDKFWEAIKEGKSGISKITSFDVSRFSCKTAGIIKDYNPLDYFTQDKIIRQYVFHNLLL